DERLGGDAVVDDVATGERGDLVGAVVAGGEEEPELVPDDGATERGLVAVDDVVLAGQRHRVGLRLPLLVLRDVLEVAVVLAGPGLGDEPGHAAAHAAVLGAVARRIGPHLGQRAGRQDDARAAAVAGVGGVDAVDERRVLLPHVAVD